MLLALLIFLTILGLAVTKTAEVWSTALTREREQELLFVGEQYRKAIERYYYATSGPNKMLPHTLDELIQDDRFPKPQRHLRKLYLDPVGDGDAWGVLRQGQRIIGVYSLSDQKPMKRAGFDARYAEFSAAQSYRGWRFLFREPTNIAGGPVPGALGTPAAPGATNATIPSATSSGKQIIPAIPSSATTPQKGSQAK